MLHAAFCAALGGVTDAAVQSKVRNLVELIIMSERMRSKALCGKKTDIAALIKVENRVNRLQRELRLEHKPRPPMSLQHYLSQRPQAGAESANESAGDAQEGGDERTSDARSAEGGCRDAG
jgi:hypothetical protein